MKALSLRQPWAAIVLFHGKRIENRRWYTSFRGPFLIHASKGMTHREFDEALECARRVLGDKCPNEADLRAQLQFGGIVGRAQIVDVVAPRPDPPLIDIKHYYPSDIGEDYWRWHFPEQFGFVLADVEPLTFVPYVGHLGFFDADVEVA